MLAGEGNATVVRVSGGSLRVSTRTGGWLILWKHWTNIQESYVMDVLVDLFWALQPQEHALVMEM